MLRNGANRTPLAVPLTSSIPDSHFLIRPISLANENGLDISVKKC